MKPVHEPAGSIHRSASLGWQRVALTSLLAMPPQNGLYKPPQSYGRGVAMVHMGDLFAYRHIKRAPSQRVELTPSEILTHCVQPGDILLARRSIKLEGVAKPALILDCGEPISFESSIIRIRPRPDLADGEYVLQFLESEFGRNEVRKIARQVAVSGVASSDLANILVPLPPLLEQRRITTVLKAWDDALDALDRLIDRRACALDAVRARLLYHHRVDETGHGRWTRVRLADVLNEHGLRSTGAEPVFSVSVHKGLVDQVKHLGRSFAAADTSQYNRVLPGDIVYTKSPTGDFPLGIIKQNLSGETVIVSPLYGVFTPATPALGFLIDRIFASPVAAKNYLTPLVQRGPKNTMSITNTQFLSGTIVLPLDKAVQTELAAFFEDGLAEIDALGRERKALLRQKRGLMQKLLTGEWRVPETVMAEVA